MKCPKCNNIMKEKNIDNASVADGDGCADYWCDKYYYCEHCSQWYDDFGECEEPVQESLI